MNAPRHLHSQAIVPFRQVVAGATLLVFALLSGASMAAREPSPAAAVLDRHLAAFAAHDLDAIMADYDDQSVFITPTGVLNGAAEIRPMFEALVEEFSAPQATVTIHQRHHSGPVAYITWSAETPANRYSLATDTLYVKGDHIRYQTFAAEIVAK